MAEKISFETFKNGVTNLTSQVKDIVDKSAQKDGICVVFTPHTTGALAITSFWDSLGHEDVQDEIRRLIPTRVDFKHQHDTPEDAAGHVKSAFIGVSLTVMVEDGTLLLGHSQGIYFLEFDGPRMRECFVKVI
jgi:secondary thiamine-phosphate synthase enzyme